MQMYKSPVQVLDVDPANNAMNIPPSTNISVKFSTDIKRDTLNGNLFVTDSKGVHVKGILTYNGPTRTCIFRPERPLDSGATYRILIQGDNTAKQQGTTGILSVVGIPMVNDARYIFTTTEIDLPKSPILVAPSDRSFTKIQDINESENIVTFKWYPVEKAVRYEIQVSKLPNFSNLYMENTIESTEFSSSHSVISGLYYWRVRGINSEEKQGKWSAVSQFTVEEFIPPPLTTGDEPVYDVMWVDEPIKVLETFPEDGFASVGTNLKSIIVKIDRPLDEEYLTEDLFQGFSESVLDSSGISDTHLMRGEVSQVIQADGSALLVWTLDSV